MSSAQKREVEWAKKKELLEAKMSDLQNNLQQSEQEMERIRATMGQMLIEEKNERSSNYTYLTTTGQNIRLVHRLMPEFDLQPLFRNLLDYLADNPPTTIPLPLADLAELGCGFPPGTKVKNRMEPKRGYL